MSETPALVGPWTMGRDKKNPTPLDTSAFNTLVKTAAEFVRRHEQQLHATLHQRVEIDHRDGRVEVLLDIEPDEENPSAAAGDGCRWDGTRRSEGAAVVQADARQCGGLLLMTRCRVSPRHR